MTELALADAQAQMQRVTQPQAPWLEAEALAWDLLATQRLAGLDEAAALASMEAATTLRRAQVARALQRHPTQRELMHSLRRLSVIQVVAFDFNGAVASARAAHAVDEQGAAREPHHPLWPQARLRLRVELAGLQLVAGDPAGARASSADALAQAEAQLRRDASHADARTAQQTSSRVLRALDDGSARREQAQWVDDLRRDLADEPQSPQAQAELARGLHTQGLTRLALGEREAALADLQAALALRLKLTDAQAPDLLAAIGLADSHSAVAAQLAARGQPAAAQTQLEAALRLHRDLSERQPVSALRTQALAATLVQLARLDHAALSAAQRRAWLTEAGALLDDFDELADPGGDVAALRRQLDAAQRGPGR